MVPRESLLLVFSREDISEWIYHATFDITLVLSESIWPFGFAGSLPMLYFIVVSAELVRKQELYDLIMAFLHC